MSSDIEGGMVGDDAGSKRAMKISPAPSHTRGTERPMKVIRNLQRGSE